MKELEKRIREDGVVLPGNVLKVNQFLNHQFDVPVGQGICPPVQG